MKKGKFVLSFFYVPRLLKKQNARKKANFDKMERFIF